MNETAQRKDINEPNTDLLSKVVCILSSLTFPYFLGRLIFIDLRCAHICFLQILPTLIAKRLTSL